MTMSVDELLSMYYLDKDKMPRKLLLELLDVAITDPSKMTIEMWRRRGYDPYAFLKVSNKKNRFGLYCRCNYWISSWTNCWRSFLASK